LAALGTRASISSASRCCNLSRTPTSSPPVSTPPPLQVCLVNGKLSSEIVSIPATSGLIVITFDKKPLALVNIKVNLNLDRVQIGWMREDANGLILFLLSLGRCLFRERQSEAQLLGLPDADAAPHAAAPAPALAAEGDVHDDDIEVEGEGDEGGAAAGGAASDADKTAVGVVDIHVTLKTLRLFLIGDDSRVEIGNLVHGVPSGKPSQIEVQATMQWLQSDGKLCGHVGATECIRTVTRLELPNIAIDTCGKDGSDRQRLLAVSVPEVTLSFLHPRPPSPAIGFSVQAAVENLYVRADLERFWFIFRFLLSPNIEEVLSREPSLFVRLGRFLYTNKATNPFNIYDSEFSVNLTVGFSSIFVPLQLHSSSSNDTCICVSFVGASLKAISDGANHSLASTDKRNFTYSPHSMYFRQVAWSAELSDLTITSAAVAAVHDPLTIHIPSVDDILGQFLYCAAPGSPLLLLKPLTIRVFGMTAIPKIQNEEHHGGAAARDRGRSDVSTVSTGSEVAASDVPTSQLRVHVELLDFALSSRGVIALLEFATKLLDWFQQQQLFKLVAFFQNLEAALASSTRTLEKEAVMPLLPSVGPELVKVTFFIDLVRIAIAGEPIDAAAGSAAPADDAGAADAQSASNQPSVSGIKVTIENVTMLVEDMPKVRSHIDIEVTNFDIQVATAGSEKMSRYHSLLLSRQPSALVDQGDFDLPPELPGAAARPFVKLTLEVVANQSSFAPTVNGNLTCNNVWVCAAPEIVSSLLVAFFQEPLLQAAHELSLVVVPYINFAAASFGREHAAHVQALQDFGISVSLENLFVLVSSTFGATQRVSVSVSGARVNASAKFNRGKEDAGVVIKANALVNSLGAWTRGGDGVDSLHKMCTVEGVSFAIAQHRDSLNDPWVVDGLDLKAPETFKMTTSKEHLLTFKRLQLKAEEQLPAIMKAGSRLHAFFSIADPPITQSVSDEHAVKLVGRALPEVSVRALEWPCVYVLGQRQHAGVLAARSTGGIAKGNELVFLFSDPKMSGSTSVVIPFDSISSVAQGNIALVFPVSVEVHACGVLHVFAHFVNRDRVFRQLRDLFQNQQHMANAMTQSKARCVSIRSTVETIALRLKGVDDMFVSFHNMSEQFDQFCDMSNRLGLQLRQRYPVAVPHSPLPQTSTSAELAAIVAAAAQAGSAAGSKASRPKKIEPPPLPPLPPALFEGWVNITTEAEQLAAAAADSDADSKKSGFFSGLAKTIKESASQTDAKILASAPLAIRKTAKGARCVAQMLRTPDALMFQIICTFCVIFWLQPPPAVSHARCCRYCAMGRQGQCKLYSDEPQPANEKTLIREVFPLFGCVSSMQVRAVNKLASKFGVSSDDANLKQIKIVDAAGRPQLLFTPFEPSDLTNFLSAAQMASMMPAEEFVEQPPTRASLDAEADSPVAAASSASESPVAAAAAGDGSVAAEALSSAVASEACDVKSQPLDAALNVPEPAAAAAAAPPALHPNAVAGKAPAAALHTCL